MADSNGIAPDAEILYGPHEEAVFRTCNAMLRAAIAGDDAAFEAAWEENCKLIGPQEKGEKK